MVDLNTCKPGDRLKTVRGTILLYVDKLPENNYYDHLIQFPNGSFGTRTNEGFVMRNPGSRLETDEDIIEILGQ